MNLYKNTANAFIEYLIKHGYPQESIALEWGNETHRIDVAILDEDLNLPVAIYEIKGEKNRNSINMGVRQLRMYKNNIGYPVKAGLVFGVDTQPYFEYIDVSEYLNNESTDLNYLLQIKSLSDKNEPDNYSNLSSSIKPKIEQKNKDRKKKKIETFNKMCWIFVCPFIFIMLLLNAFDLYDFTFERLMAIGALIVIFILPFFTEIKFGDVFLVRNNKRHDVI